MNELFKLSMRILIILLLFFSLCARAQDSSLIYNASRQLIADTSFVLTESELENWKRFENLLINEIINKLHYSDIAIENRLQGHSIISFEVDENGKLASFIRIESVGGGLEERLKVIIERFSFLNSLKAENGSTSKYYLSLSFNLIDINHEIQSTGIITIGGNMFDFIQK